MKKPLLFFWSFCFFCAAAFAQSTGSASASVDKTSILIGEPLQLTLEASFSNTHTPSFFVLDSVPHFEILNRSKIDTLQEAARTLLQQRITLTSWDSGAWALPAFTLAGNARITTKPVSIQVCFSPMPANQEYHDVKDILDVAPPPRETWYWYIIGAVIVLLLVLLPFPKKKKELFDKSAVPTENAYRQALRELDTLQQKTIPDDKEYFTELVQIFRTYLHRRTGIHSFQKTTGGLSGQLQKLALPHGDLKKLEESLQLSDFVKFARYTPAETERAAAWEDIKKSIVAIEALQK